MKSLIGKSQANARQKVTIFRNWTFKIKLIDSNDEWSRFRNSRKSTTYDLLYTIRSISLSLQYKYTEHLKQQSEAPHKNVTYSTLNILNE